PGPVTPYCADLRLGVLQPLRHRPSLPIPCGLSKVEICRSSEVGEKGQLGMRVCVVVSSVSSTSIRRGGACENYLGRAANLLVTDPVFCLVGRMGVWRASVRPAFPYVCAHHHLPHDKASLCNGPFSPLLFSFINPGKFLPSTVFWTPVSSASSYNNLYYTVLTPHLPYTTISSTS
ncbi:hypothetical protein LY78DRAFT_709040, partial [Colletotrichum sublineola]